jgi:hypothetical protein
VDLKGVEPDEIVTRQMSIRPITYFKESNEDLSLNNSIRFGPSLLMKLALETAHP